MRQPLRSTVDWVLEGLALLLLILLFGTLALHWSELPARVPKHFGITGRPDAWGGKNSLFLLPAVALGVYALLSAVASRPHLLNVPWSIDKSLAENQRLLRSMTIAIKVVVLLMFSYIEWASVATALGHSAGLGAGFLPLSLVGLFVTLAFYFTKLRDDGNSTS